MNFGDLIWTFLGSPALFFLLQSRGARQLSDYLSISRDRIGQRTGNIEAGLPATTETVFVPNVNQYDHADGFDSAPYRGVENGAPLAVRRPPDGGAVVDAAA